MDKTRFGQRHRLPQAPNPSKEFAKLFEEFCPGVPLMRPGPRNLITDVAGLAVGNADDPHLRSGVTVLTADHPFVAAVHVMGGAPGTRETDLLAPDRLVQEVDAIFLSGGSAFGLDAGTGVMAGLRAHGSRLCRRSSSGAHRAGGDCLRPSERW